MALKRFGVTAAGIGAVAILAYWTTNNDGPITRAFYDAPRDSSGAEASEQVLKVIPAGVHHADIARTFARDGFDCHRSRLLQDRQLWTCQRQAFRLNGLPNTERWVVEFECRKDFTPCTIETLHAEVRA
ncbi:MAG: hypothetical protein AB7V13_06035 [Pseudorhodoplanes sp.]|uniref:hypothetical protein n=1 Tax=Pseudorhodoplanes sp. TaxID=1934341 RepID=UPI003D133A89